MKPAKQPTIRLSGPASGSVRSLEALTDDELAQRADDALRVLQAIRDEQEQRRWKNERPTIVYTGGDPNIRATFR